MAPSWPLRDAVLLMDVRPADCVERMDLLGCGAEGAVLRAELMSSPSKSFPNSSGDVCCMQHNSIVCIRCCAGSFHSKQYANSGLRA